METTYTLLFLPASRFLAHSGARIHDCATIHHNDRGRLGLKLELQRKLDLTRGSIARRDTRVRQIPWSPVYRL